MLSSPAQLRRAFVAVWVAAGGAAGSTSYAFGQSRNLEVFRAAARDLFAGADLYAGRSVDFFKYSPTFALLFTPFAWLPAWLAAALWGALNFGVAFAGIDALVRDPRRKIPAFAAGLAGVLFATDGDQSNLLITGAMLLAVAALESGKWRTFAVLVALAAHVKIFPVALLPCALLYPKPVRSLAAALASIVAFALLPALVVGAHGLAAEYASWLALVRRDHANHGWSVMNMIESFSGRPVWVAGIQGLGVVFLMLPLVATRILAGRAWRRLYAASVLVFTVLFNHRAEYATYVVSAIGAAIWYAENPRSRLRIVLLAATVVAQGPLLTAPDPSVTGLFAILGAHRLFHPLRVMPLAILWGSMQIDLVRALVVDGVRADAFRPSTPGPESLR